MPLLLLIFKWKEEEEKRKAEATDEGQKSGRTRTALWHEQQAGRVSRRDVHQVRS